LQLGTALFLWTPVVEQNEQESESNFHRKTNFRGRSGTARLGVGRPGDAAIRGISIMQAAIALPFPHQHAGRCKRDRGQFLPAALCAQRAKGSDVKKGQ